MGSVGEAGGASVEGSLLGVAASVGGESVAGFGGGEVLSDGAGSPFAFTGWFAATAGFCFAAGPGTGCSPEQAQSRSIASPVDFLVLIGRRMTDYEYHVRMPALRISRWSLALVLAAGCRPGTRVELPESEPASEVASSETEGVEEGASGDELPAEPTHPLEMVPARASGMLMARSLQRIAEIWERDRLAGQYPEVYADMARPFLRDFEIDLFDPGQVTKLGLDPSAPVGVAMIDPHNSAIAFFGGLSDPDLFLTSLQGFVESSPKIQNVGTARLMVLKEGFEQVSVVVRGTMFAVVIWSDGDFDGVHPVDYAYEVATISPSGSLAHAEPMKRAHAALADDADLHGLLDPAGLVFGEIEWERRRSRDRLKAAEVELAEARSRGASADELRNLQEMINATRVELMAKDRELQVVNLLLSRTVGSIEGIGMSVKSSDEGLLGAIHIALTPDSVARELFVSDDAPPRALLAADLEPLFAAAGRVDVDVALGLLAQLMLATGSSYAEVNEEIRRDTTLDFDRQLRPLLDGRAALMIVDAEPMAGKKARDIDDWLTGAMTVGLKDPNEARELLKQIEPALIDVGWTKAKEIEGYTRMMGSAPDQLWMAVIDDQLVLSTDLPMLRKIAQGKPGSASTTMPSDAAWARLTEGRTVFRAGIGHGLISSTFFGFSMGFRDVKTAAVAELSSDMNTAQIRMGPKVRRAMERVEDLDNLVFELGHEQVEERARMSWQRLGALGMTIGAARMTDTGILIEGGHYIRGGMGRYVETFMGLEALGRAPTSVDAKLDKARADRDAAQERFNRMRMKEVERALKKQAN